MMKVITEQTMGFSDDEIGLRRGWYVVNDQGKILAGPYVWMNDARLKKLAMEAEEKEDTKS